MSWTVQQQFHAEKNEGELITRNNTMRTFVEFLEYESTNKTDILQEYFIPLDEFESFTNSLRKIVEEEDLNLLNVTIRYTKANEEAFLTYAHEDTLAFVLLFNHPTSEKGVAHMKQATEKIVDAAIDVGGTHYLTYQLFPTKEQVKKAYPNVDDFFKKKREYDPDELFMNNFYKEYNTNE